MSHKPFRFGLQAFNPPSAAAWREMLRKTEDLGYSAYHLADHILQDKIPYPIYSDRPTSVRVIDKEGKEHLLLVKGTTRISPAITRSSSIVWPAKDSSGE